MAPVIFWMLFVLATPDAPDLATLTRWCQEQHPAATVTFRKGSIPMGEAAVRGLQVICWPPNPLNRPKPQL